MTRPKQRFTPAQRMIFALITAFVWIILGYKIATQTSAHGQPTTPQPILGYIIALIGIAWPIIVYFVWYRNRDK